MNDGGFQPDASYLEKILPSGKKHVVPAGNNENPAVEDQVFKRLVVAHNPIYPLISRSMTLKV